MTAAYYNEIDPYAAHWLRNLIKAGHIAPGDVDERSIVDVPPDDLRGYTQAHFFAGIGGWSIALRLAGWPDDRPVWTGSCPCQPFSAAGAGKAGDDERHLWPAWFSLIQELRPPVVFGEQVEAAIGWGWLDAVFADLEGEGYACGAAVLPACGVGAPHIRQRAWFVADADGGDAGTEGLQRGGQHRQQPKDCGPCRGRGWVLPSFGANFAVACDRCRGTGRVVDAAGEQARFPGRSREPGSAVAYSESSGSGTGLRHRRPATQRQSVTPNDSGLGHADGEREAPAGGLSRGPRVERGRGSWAEAEWIECRDNKRRPIEPGSSPLAHGIQRRASKLRAYGNAIVPQAAAAFVSAFLEQEPRP